MTADHTPEVKCETCGHSKESHRGGDTGVWCDECLAEADFDDFAPQHHFQAEQRYATIVADPPWDYGELSSAGSKGWVGFGQRTPGRDGAVNGRGAQQHYGLMPLAEIKALRVAVRFAMADAHLYLWAPVTFVVEARTVMEAWGFTYKTMLTWVKPSIGMGYYFRTNTEHVLFGVRGKLRTLRRDVPTAFTAPRTRHSEKPDAFFDMVESQSPGPYLSIFERRNRLGWDAIGDELGTTIKPQSLAESMGIDTTRCEVCEGELTVERPWREGWDGARAHVECIRRFA